LIELSGAHKEISSQNLILYMNIIEEKVGEIFSRRKLEMGGIGSEIGTPSRGKSPRPSSRTGSTFSASVRRNKGNVGDLSIPAAGSE